MEEPASDEVGGEMVGRKNKKKKKPKGISERSPLMFELADIFQALEVWFDSLPGLLVTELSLLTGEEV